MGKIKLDQHYVDPRLVELYDIENPLGADSDFYLQLAAELNVKTIVDLGCGTGLLTRELAVDGRRVIGVDPAPAMLAVAKRGANSERVRWIEGSAADLGEQNADLVIMTGNVAQVFLEDDEWQATLNAIHSTLRPGGHIAFESRNPDAKTWERWNPDTTLQTLDSPSGPIKSWLEVVDANSKTVSFRGTNIFLDTDEEVVVDSTLRFRSRAEITASLQNAGFTIKHIFGSWDREPMHGCSRLMIFVACRT